MSRWLVLKIGGNQYERHDLPGEIIGEFDSIDDLPAPERYDHKLGDGGPDWFEWWAYELGGGKRTLQYRHSAKHPQGTWKRNAWCEDGDVDHIVREDFL